jgi:hypothetical protein
MPRPLYSCRKSPRPLNKRRGGPQSMSVRFGEDRNTCNAGSRSRIPRSSSPKLIHYRVWTGSIWIRTIHSGSFVMPFDIPNRRRIYWPTECFCLTMDFVPSKYPGECRNIFRRRLIIYFQVFSH